MSTPAIQLYFGDWRKNANLRRCSWGSRGVWLEVMALMHDSDEYGVLRWPLSEIVTAIGCPLPLVKELATKNVIKGSDKAVEAYRWAPSHAGKRGTEIVLIHEQEGPLWYSSRMVRDEYKRSNRGVATRFGGSPNPSPTGTPSQRVGDGKGGTPSHVNGVPSGGGKGDGASSSSSLVLPHGLTDSHRSAGAREEPKTIATKVAQIQPRGRWYSTPDGIVAEGKRLGMEARRGEEMDDFKARIFEAIATQHRGVA